MHLLFRLIEIPFGIREPDSRPVYITYDVVLVRCLELLHVALTNWPCIY